MVALATHTGPALLATLYTLGVRPAESAVIAANKAGDQVAAGAQIGLLGNSGNTSAPHRVAASERGEEIRAEKELLEQLARAYRRAVPRAG